MPRRLVAFLSRTGCDARVRDSCRLSHAALSAVSLLCSCAKFTRVSPAVSPLRPRRDCRGHEQLRSLHAQRQPRSSLARKAPRRSEAVGSVAAGGAAREPGAHVAAGGAAHGDAAAPRGFRRAWSRRRLRHVASNATQAARASLTRALWLRHAYRSARAACSARTAASLLKPRRAPRLALAPAAAVVVSNKRCQRRGLRSAPAGARSGAALSPALSSCCGAGLLLAPSATAGPRVASASASDAAAMPAAHSSAMRRRRGGARRPKSRAGALCANYRAREGWAHFCSAISKTTGRKQKGPRPPEALPLEQRSAGWCTLRVTAVCVPFAQHGACRALQPP